MSPTSRRSLLHTVGVAVATLAGCLGGTSVDPPAAATAESTPSTATTAKSDPTTTTRQPSGPTMPEPTRPRGEPISTREAYVDGEEYTYLPEENAVEYVSAYRHTNHEAVENGSAPEREPVYDTVPFERWGRVRCASVAASTVAETTADRLGHAELDASVGITSRGGVPTVTVARTITYDRQGNRVSATDVPFEDLVAAAPRWVETTVSLAGREYETTVPVWVRAFEQRQQ
ncbi:hypothetical protein C2R22_17440 [Salinigranum rubrum]|uniref:Uncharacterized protein n=1 Tax=Salinigranum rubrum TaxID=755307 RepID=A0A2I8VMP0_9EURY|nr:hypothetical protein [Salinigranum rubrum]AUV83207.1 hypothetical protein C2R22_17440 [Salinigranum rubrum]